MEKVRCKFMCNLVSKGGTKDDPTRTYEFTAVYGDSGENAKYWKYTPSGQLSISSVSVDLGFEPGECYYLDITVAPKE